MNDFFTSAGSKVTRHTLARAAALNSALDAIEAGFDKLPDALPLNQNRVTYAGTDSGAANGYAIDLTQAPAEYVEGLSVTFRPANSNTGPSTLNVNGLGVKAILRWDGNPLQAGDLLASSMADLRYDGLAFRLTNPAGVVTIAAQTAANAAAQSAQAAENARDAAAQSAQEAASSAEDATNAKDVVENAITNAIFRPGDTKETFRADLEPGWLWCDGATYDSVADPTKADLYDAIGTTFGGTGPDDFKVPDAEQRITVTRGSGSRVTTGVSGIDATALGATGGDQRMQQHDHPTDPHDHGYQGRDGLGSKESGGSTNHVWIGTGNRTTNNATVTVNNAGSGTAQNMPPVIVVNRMIKY